MEKLIEKLKSKDDFCSLLGVTEEEVREAEQMLCLTFAKDYRDYLLAFGIASFEGHELTGIVKSPRLNVVEQTVTERASNPYVPDDLYVIETANIDGIVIWQKSSGAVFQTIFDSAPTQICKTLTDYVDL